MIKVYRLIVAIVTMVLSASAISSNLAYVNDQFECHKCGGSNQKTRVNNTDDIGWMHNIKEIKNFAVIWNDNGSYCPGGEYYYVDKTSSAPTAIRLDEVNPDCVEVRVMNLSEENGKLRISGIRNQDESFNVLID